MVTLCRFHHRKLHEGEFSVTVHPDIQDDFLFVDTEDNEIEPTRSPTFPEQDDVTAEVLDIEKYRPDVSAECRPAETCVTKWMGDTMDEAWVLNLVMESDNRAKNVDPDGAAPPG